MKLAVAFCLLGVFLVASAHWDGHMGAHFGLRGGYLGDYGVRGGNWLRDEGVVVGGAHFNSDIGNVGGQHQTVNEVGGVIGGYGMRSLEGFGRANTDIDNVGGHHQTVNRIGGVLNV